MMTNNLLLTFFVLITSLTCQAKSHLSDYSIIDTSFSYKKIKSITYRNPLDTVSYIFKYGMLSDGTRGVQSEGYQCKKKGAKQYYHIPCGIWKTYYKSGNLRGIGVNKGHFNEGEWSFFHENGALKQKLNYKQGVLLGKYEEYSEQGKKILDGNYIHKFIEDTCFTEGIGGEIFPEPCSYNKAIKDGKWIVYDYHDEIVETQQWKNDEIIKSEWYNMGDNK